MQQPRFSIPGFGGRHDEQLLQAFEDRIEDLRRQSGGDGQSLADAEEEEAPAEGISLPAAAAAYDDHGNDDAGSAPGGGGDVGAAADDAGATTAAAAVAAKDAAAKSPLFIPTPFDSVALQAASPSSGRSSSGAGAAAASEQEWAAADGGPAGQGSDGRCVEGGSSSGDGDGDSDGDGDGGGGGGGGGGGVGVGNGDGGGGDGDRRNADEFASIRARLRRVQAHNERQKLQSVFLFLGRLRRAVAERSADLRTARTVYLHATAAAHRYADLSLDLQRQIEELRQLRTKDQKAHEEEMATLARRIKHADMQLRLRHYETLVKRDARFVERYVHEVSAQAALRSEGPVLAKAAARLEARVQTDLAAVDARCQYHLGTARALAIGSPRPLPPVQQQPATVAMAAPFSPRSATSSVASSNPTSPAAPAAVADGSSVASAPSLASTSLAGSSAASSLSSSSSTAAATGATTPLQRQQKLLRSARRRRPTSVSAATPGGRRAMRTHQLIAAAKPRPPDFDPEELLAFESAATVMWLAAQCYAVGKQHAASLHVLGAGLRQGGQICKGMFFPVLQQHLYDHVDLAHGVVVPSPGATPRAVNSRASFHSGGGGDGSATVTAAGGGPRSVLLQQHCAACGRLLRWVSGLNAALVDAAAEEHEESSDAVTGPVLQASSARCKREARRQRQQHHVGGHGGGGGGGGSHGKQWRQPHQFGPGYDEEHLLTTFQERLRVAAAVAFEELPVEWWVYEEGKFDEGEHDESGEDEGENYDTVDSGNDDSARNGPRHGLRRGEGRFGSKSSSGGGGGRGGAGASSPRSRQHDAAARRRQHQHHRLPGTLSPRSSGLQAVPGTGGRYFAFLARHRRRLHEAERRAKARHDAAKAMRRAAAVGAAAAAAEREVRRVGRAAAAPTAAAAARQEAEHDDELLMEALESNELELEVFQNFGEGSGRHFYNFIHQFQMEKDRLSSVDHVRRLVRARARLHDRLVHRAHWQRGNSTNINIAHPPHHVVDSNNHTPGTAVQTMTEAMVEQATERLRRFDDKITAAVDDHHVIFSDEGVDFVDHEMAAWEKAKEHRRWDLQSQ